MHPFVHCRSHMCMCLCVCMRARVVKCTRAKQATSGAPSYRPKKARVQSSSANRCRMFVPASRSLTLDLIPSNGDLQWIPRSSPWDLSFSAAREGCESGRERAGGRRAEATERDRECQEEAGRGHAIKAPHCLWHVPQTNWSQLPVAMVTRSGLT